MDRWIIESPCRYIIYGLDQMPYNNLRWLGLLYCVSYQSQAKIFTQSLGRKRRKDRNIAVLASQRQILLLTMVNQLNIHPQALTHGSEFHTAEVTVTNNSMVMSVTLLKPFSIPPLLHSFSAFAQSPFESLTFLFFHLPCWWQITNNWPVVISM